MNVLALIAHPDDLEIAAAGTICSLTKNQHRVLIAVVTDDADTNIRDVRQTEALRAAKNMGVPEKQVLFLGQEDRFAKNDHTTCRKLQNWLKTMDCQPDIVITHTKNDTHQDHRAVRKLAFSATRKSASLYLFAAVINSLRKDDFQPTVFVDTSDYWASKIKALSCYPSQDALGRIRVEEIDKHERAYAEHLNVSRVEAFETTITNQAHASWLLSQFALLKRPQGSTRVSNTRSNNRTERPVSHAPLASM